jgi:predicted O-linked N-acetylglucosamine transferase (SPINDLY family)
VVREGVIVNPVQAQQLLDLVAQYTAAGRLAEAEQLLLQILAVQPGRAEAIKCLANIFRLRGQYERASSAYRRALELRPEDVEVQCNLGATLTDQGLLDDAVAVLSRLIRFWPHLAVAYNNRGIALRKQGRFAEAVDDYRRALQRQPEFFEACFNLGNALKEMGELEQAVAAYQQALRMNSNDTAVCNNLGITLTALGRPNEAVAIYEQAIRFDDRDARTYNNLGLALRDAGQLDGSGSAFRRALEIRPDYAMALRNLGSVLRDQGQLDGALAAYRRSADLAPQDPSGLSNVIYALQFHPGQKRKEIAEARREWNRRFAQPLMSSTEYYKVRDPDRRLRIGYVSADFREHVIGRNLLPLLRHHDRRKFEVVCYSGVARKDGLTAEFRQLADHWRDLGGASDLAVANQIREDGVDIMVDLTQHMSGNRLPVFVRKPAPLAMSFAGYPDGTGLDSIPYRISDRFLEGAGAWDESVALVESFWCYDPCGAEVAVNALPARQSGWVTYGCLNHFAKFNEPVLRLFGALLRRVENSRVLFLAAAGTHREWVRRVLWEEGVDASRVGFAEIRPRLEYLGLYQQVDIALDPFPYNGHTTSLDALWMGVPVVSLAGENPAARGGVSLLSNLNLPELITWSPEEYVQIAGDLASDLDRLGGLRATLRSRLEASLLMDGWSFARNIEAAYRAAWRRWCRTPAGV